MEETLTHEVSTPIFFISFKRDAPEDERHLGQSWPNLRGKSSILKNET